ncbi:hypothetical protein ACFLVX_01760 [Chloroflexota bacterium]
MRRQPSAVAGGLGLGLLLWVVLEMAKVSLPLWLLIPLGVIALWMIVRGYISFIVDAFAGVGRVIQRVRLRAPITVAQPQDETQQTPQEQTPQEQTPPAPADAPALEEEPKLEISYATPRSRPKAILDVLIERGGQLNSEMSPYRFNTTKLASLVEQWLDRISHDVWDAFPLIVASTVRKLGNPKSAVSLREDILRQDAWPIKAATLRTTVERELERLKEIRKKI